MTLKGEWSYSDNAIAIYKRLYFDKLKGETKPSETHSRIAKFVSNTPTEKGKFYNLLEKKIFRPNSPCMINAGSDSKNPHDRALSACYVLGLEDSMDSIIEMWGVCAKIYASGAGSGIPITNLREKGATISTGGSASGPLAYLNVVDMLSNTVRSGGKTRRAANMGIFKYNHPDVMEILDSKLNGNIQTFNLSMSTTDYFMKEVNSGKDIRLKSPQKSKYKKARRKLSIDEIWTKVVINAWTNGDPGLFFFDTVNKFNPTPSLGDIDCTNPCLSNNTLLLTKEGYEEIQNLVGKKLEIWNGHEWTMVEPTVTGYNQKMLNIIFNNGEELYCTHYHKFKLKDNREIEAKNLVEGDQLAKWTMPVLSDPTNPLDEYNIDPYTQGVYCGDGFWDNYHNWPCIRLYGEKEKLLENLDYINYRTEDERTFLRLSNIYHHKNFVPINNYSLNYKLSYLAGICDTDGTLTKDGSIQISSVDFNYLLNLKRMINTMGIDGKINISHESKIKDMPDGNGNLKPYNCKTCYRLSIAGWQVQTILTKLNFKTFRLNTKDISISRDSSHYIKVEAILDQNQVDKKVYCFKDPIRGMGMFNNISTLQCGEVPLPPWSVCNIGSINVSYFVTEIPTLKTMDASFRWMDFKEAVEDAFVFLDNVIDKQDYIHPKFMKNAKDWRPVGLGIMGFADALIKMNIPYDSKEAKEFFERICYELNSTCIKKSVQMAKDGEWGTPIPGEDQEHMYNLLKYYTKEDEQLLADFEEYGIHNTNWTMIAPTGSTSMSADCSYAWEPLMALVWEKPLVESNEVLKIIHPQFKKDLNEFCNNQNISFNKIIEDIIDNNGSIQNMAVFPQPMKDIYKVAHDIDPIVKIKMQGAGQKWISMAISSTTNLPNSATIEDVDIIYKTAWEHGLKGITVFRDGCRENQVVQFGKKKIIKEKEIIKQRPIKRDGSTVEIKTPHGKFYVTVNYHDDKPIEMFFSVGKQGGLVNVVIDALARICSKGLQAGMTMEWIVDTLEGLKGDVPFWFKIADDIEKQEQAESIVDALAKVLEYHFMPDNGIIKLHNDIPYDPEAHPEIYADDRYSCEDKVLFQRCPECGKKGLNRRSGCRGGECMFCGFSNCS